MSLKPIVYESLTIQQRIIATFDALGREDEEEVQRLKETCPFKNYRQRDSAYSDTVESILMLSLAIECDLNSCALSYLGSASESEERNKHLQEMANIHGGWLALLNELGICADAMLRAAPTRHSIVEQLLTIIPPCEADAVKVSLETFKKQIHA